MENDKDWVEHLKNIPITEFNIDYSDKDLYRYLNNTTINFEIINFNNETTD